MRTSEVPNGLFDTHCHLPDNLPAEAREDWVKRAIAAGVDRLALIGTAPDDWDVNRQLASIFPDNVFWTAGLHPSYVDPQSWQDDLSSLCDLLAGAPSPAPLAIGEIGLDFTRIKRDASGDPMREAQRAAFRAQLALAKAHATTVVIHSRESIPECIAVIDDSGIPWERFIFHCFTGTAEEAGEVLSRGGWISFTGIITFRNAHNVREALRTAGLERLILETDSPYLSPEPLRGQENHPAHLIHVRNYCATFFCTTPGEITAVSNRNANRFFKLP